jgi:hypothetical protein
MKYLGVIIDENLNFTKLQIKRLLVTQWKILLRVISVYRTVSYISAWSIAGIFPIDFKIKERNTIEECKTFKDWKGCSVKVKYNIIQARMNTINE